MLTQKLQKVGQGVMRLAARKSRKDVVSKQVYVSSQVGSLGVISGAVLCQPWCSSWSSWYDVVRLAYFLLSLSVSFPLGRGHCSDLLQEAPQRLGSFKSWILSHISCQAWSWAGLYSSRCSDVSLSTLQLDWTGDESPEAQCSVGRPLQCHCYALVSHHVTASYSDDVDSQWTHILVARGLTSELMQSNGLDRIRLGHAELIQGDIWV